MPTQVRLHMMKHLLRLLGAFFRRDLYTELSYKLAFVLSFSTVFFTTFSFFFISKIVDPENAAITEYGGNYFAFVIIGLALSNFFTLGLNGFANALRRAQTTGTMEALLMTPVSLSYIVIGSALWSYLFTSLRVVLYLILGIVLGLRISSGNWIAASLIFILTIISSASIGIIAASIIMIVKRGNPITALFGSVASMVSGVWYSVEILPDWLQQISKLIPLTYSLAAMRDALLKGAPWSQLLPNIVALLTFCILLFPLSLYIFRRAVLAARRDGTLTHY